MMLRDHLEALALLTDRGLPLEKALARLDPGQLGGFYLSERTDWYPLDHAAKIYPMSMGLKRMMVFRLSCYLKKPVEPAIMQMALSYTIRRFPYFATTVKCGFFWHYIDSAMRRFAVRQESKLPCAVMKLGQVSSPTLRVVYWQNRVSVEFFHILTDGTGGSVFLRTLVKTYLRLLGESVSDGPETLCLDQPPDPPSGGTILCWVAGCGAHTASRASPRCRCAACLPTSSPTACCTLTFPPARCLTARMKRA